MGRPLTVGRATAQRKQRMVNDGAVDLGSSWSSDKVGGLLERRNLLDNWDWRGANADPRLSAVVNQLGRTAYGAAGYAIDRWLSHGEHLLMLSEIVDGAVRLTRSLAETSVIFSQRIEFWQRLLGKTVTASAMVGGKVRSSTMVLPQAASAGSTGRLPSVVAEPFLGSWCFRLVNNPADIMRFDICSQRGGIDDFIDIQAVKLELGPVSTLANDPPMDFGAELAKCQRYQLRVSSGTSRYRMSNRMANALHFNIPVPATMRTHPALAGGEVGVVVNGGGVGGFAFSFTSGFNSLEVTATKNGHGLTDAALFVTNALFDANL